MGLGVSGTMSAQKNGETDFAASFGGSVADQLDGPASASAPVHKFAVIIGIVYDNYEFGWINFADKDAAAVYSLLTQKMGFPAENVILLQNSEASRNNITDALDWLVDNPDVDENSEVVIYYSGHGVRSGPGVGMNIPELPSAYALAPFDFMNYDFKKGAGLIWDTELADKLSQISPAKMWVSIDSCSSGGFLRPGITGPNRIVTASSRGDELSSEIDPVQRGVFTQLVVEEGLARGLTVEEAFAAAAPRASGEFGQNPQIADEYPGSMGFR